MRSWDVTGWNVLAFAMQLSTTGALDDDMVRPTGYVKDEYLAWKASRWSSSPIEYSE